MRFPIALVVAVLTTSTTLRAQPRTIVPGNWVEVQRVDADHRYAFSEPRMIALSGDAIIVYDDGAHRVLSFTRDGNLLWELGQEGAPAQKLDHPMALVGDGKGGAIVLDSGGYRVSEISSLGAMTKRTDLPRPWHQIAVMQDGRLVGASFFGDDLYLLEEWIKQGAGFMDVRMPRPKMGKGGTVVRIVSGPMLQTSASGGLVQAFQAATAVRVLNAKLKSTKSFELLDKQEFAGDVLPTVDRPLMNGRSRPVGTNRRVVQSISFENDSLYVIDDRTMMTTPVLDVYSTLTGHYAKSRELPKGELLNARIDHGMLYALVYSPMPAVVVWKWVE